MEKKCKKMKIYKIREIMYNISLFENTKKTWNAHWETGERLCACEACKFMRAYNLASQYSAANYDTLTANKIKSYM